MASAQVWRKQEHLEAGKRKLEEFRKKKAAERAKKTPSAGQPRTSDVSLQEKHHPEDDHMRVIDSNGAGTSDGPDKAVSGSTLVTNKNENKLVESAQQRQQRSLEDTADISPFSENNFSLSSSDIVQNYLDSQENEMYVVTGSSRSVVNNSQEKKDINSESVVYSKDQARVPYGSLSDQFVGLRTETSQDQGSDSGKSSFLGLKELQSKENESSLKASTVVNSLHDFNAKISPQISVSSLLQSKPNTDVTLGNGRIFDSSFEDSTQPSTSRGGFGLEFGQTMRRGPQFCNPLNLDMGKGNLSSSVSAFSSVHSVPVETSKSSGFSFEDRSSSNHVPIYSATNEFNSRRSRPSFLDSLKVPRSSSEAPFQQTEPENMDVPESSAVQKPSLETDIMGPFSQTKTSNTSSAIDYLGSSSVPASGGGHMLRRGGNEKSMESLYSSKQNEDFAALEQHIEDLTQEKFSLQRSLEASRALAESLAAENTSLTDSYNQQRSVVNQLKSDMEKLQEEIKTQLVELESFRNEYANARLECSAADERASILASEVIGLEEKALRLRSSELKLERQLEDSHAEISSYKKKMSGLEKERQDLQSTIDALQEEKKVLQSKLRKASRSAKSIDFNRSPASGKDMSTSTEDLANSDATADNNNQEIHDTSHSGINASSSPVPSENGELSVEVSDVNIPFDQMRMIKNINALISELALEKEELIRALSSELSQSSKLQDLNKDLSRKLEAQTQRLELLTAQSMAHEITSIRQPDSQIMPENTPYADEGDEVVERVLGWIMKLFPAGPSRRRTSKLL